MAKRNSKDTKTKKNKTSKKTNKEKKSIFAKFKAWRVQYKENKKNRVRPHKSFRRSYREDYRRDLKVPGVNHHIFATFKVIFRNWKLFLPLIAIVVVLNIVLVGIMDEETYEQFREALDQTSQELAGNDIGNFAKSGLLLISTVTTGGLSTESSETSTIFLIIFFLIIWLVSIYIVRHILAGHKIKLRDALYNASTPLISTFVVFLIAVIQCIPIILLIIVYSAAVQTEFLSTPFYALVFFVFALAMILLSGYLLSSSLIALVAVSAPGLYPMRAIHASSDLMMGRRFKFIIRIITLVLAMAVTWVIVMIPIILFDMWLKTFEWAGNIPVVPFFLLVMTCFTFVYMSVYFYLYYRWMLDYDEEN